MSAESANVNFGESAIGDAFGVGGDYFAANQEKKAEIVANETTLEKGEWETLSDRMVQVAQSQLVGINDLRGAGLVRGIAYETMIDLWQRIGEFTPAAYSMAPEVDSREDQPTYEQRGVPVPVTHKNFRVGDRKLRASRTRNNDLRTDGISLATRAVSEGLEKLLFNGWNNDPNGPDMSVTDAEGESYTLYGYTTHPDRNALSAGADWTNALDSDSQTTANIRGDIVAMIDALDQDNYASGGYWLYIAPEQWRELRQAIDSHGDGNLGVRERLMQDFSDELGKIRRAPALDPGNAVMVEPRPEVVELAMAEDIQTVEWMSNSGYTHFFKVLAIMAPEIKSDAKGQSGIAHLTGI
jgi:uncharacterized linocin/CFP29 family protein